MKKFTTTFLLCLMAINAMHAMHIPYQQPNLDEIVDAIMQGKADINAEVVGGFTALMWAALAGEQNNVQKLLDLGAPIDFTPLKNGETALTLASSNGYVSITQLLLNYGADINQRDRLGNTPLINAAGLDLENILRLLLERGAKTTLKNNCGYTAFGKAAGCRSHTCCKLLVERMLQIPGPELQKRIITFLLRAKKNPLPKDLCILVAKELMHVSLAEYPELSVAYQAVTSLHDRWIKKELFETYFPNLEAGLSLNEPKKKMQKNRMSNK